MSLCLENNYVLAIDDKATINACKVMNIKFVTAIDFILSGFRKNKIGFKEAKEKILKLDRYGRYDSRIIKKALEEIGDKNE